MTVASTHSTEMPRRSNRSSACRVNTIFIGVLFPAELEGKGPHWHARRSWVAFPALRAAGDDNHPK